jgi:hypothetical protein
MSAAGRLVAAAVLLVVAVPASLRAQPPQGGAAPAPQPPRQSAPLDLTGQWVAIVNEDWRWRMVTPPKGDYASVPLTPEGKRVADTWDASKDGACEAYGAAGLMRMPTRLRVSWDGDEVLKVETDAGRQTRLLSFKPAANVASTPRSLQGVSQAAWVRPQGGAGGPGLAGAGGSAGKPTGGYLKVTTTNLTAGWLRKNGVPYSENAMLTEYFDRFSTSNGDEWLMVTAIVEDPIYLNTRYVTSSHFKREPSGGRWSPKPCGGAQ